MLQDFIVKLRVANYELNLSMLFSKTFAELTFETARFIFTELVDATHGLYILLTTSLQKW